MKPNINKKKVKIKIFYWIPKIINRTVKSINLNIVKVMISIK